MDRNRTVFVVDDHEDSADFIKELLAQEGYDVEARTDPLEALSSLRAMQQPPCLILLDMLMPQLDGLSFVNALRLDQSLPDIPVVFVSASHQAAARSGLPFLSKPVDPDVLLEVVRQHCRED